MARFETVGLTRADLFHGDELENPSQTQIQKIFEEPDNEKLINTIVRAQNKDQKAKQSYESNLDVQGFGETATSGFGFFKSKTDGFGVSSMRSLARPQSAFMGGLDENNSAMGNGERLNPMTEAGDVEEEEH